jgi:hypothetical protein
VLPGWADENGDWLHNSLYVRVIQNAIRCGDCRHTAGGPDSSAIGARSHKRPSEDGRDLAAIPPFLKPSLVPVGAPRKETGGEGSGDKPHYQLPHDQPNAVLDLDGDAVPAVGLRTEAEWQPLPIGPIHLGRRSTVEVDDGVSCRINHRIAEAPRHSEGVSVAALRRSACWDALCQ